MGSKQTLKLDHGPSSQHEHAEGNHAEGDRLGGDGEEKVLSLLTALVLGRSIHHGEDEAGQELQMVEAEEVIHHLATSLTSGTGATCMYGDNEKSVFAMI
jgi:hypothetical protein